MAGVNKVILIGNLGKDPEIRTMESGRKVANFPLATTEVYRDRSGERVETTEWHNIVLWGPSAEVAEKYLRKGMQVFIEGKLRTRSYEDKEGAKKYITEIQGQTLTMLGGKQQGGEGGNGGWREERSSEKSESVGAGIMSDDTDDLPF